jgi:uncharacterized protein
MSPSSIDRIGPTLRPSGTPRGYQRWRHLLFVHWPVPTELLRKVIPPALDVDTFDGQAYVGLIPFAMEGVRPAWIPEALAFDFLETNLRTYVHVRGEDPGIYFFSLEAASRVAVTAARIGWSLPYHFARMQMSTRGDEISYATTRSSNPAASLTVDYRIEAFLGASAPGTLEHFLFERYLLHTERRGRILTGQVHHQPYPVRRATVHRIEEGLRAASGLPPAPTEPTLTHYAEGVDVEIFDLAPRRR